MSSLERRPALWVAGVALGALALALLLAVAFAFAPRPRPAVNGDALRTTLESRAGPAARDTTAERTIGTPTFAPVANEPRRPLQSPVDRRPLLWTLVAPWARVVDLLAVLGMAAVLAVRYAARHRRSART